MNDLDTLVARRAAIIRIDAEFRLSVRPPNVSKLIDAFDYCGRIRNKYAHAYWHDPDNGTALCYVSLEELADEEGPVNDLTNLVFYHLDEPLLLRQEAYYRYVLDLLRYVNYEGQFRSKKLRENIFPLPIASQKPLFFTHKS